MNKNKRFISMIVVVLLAALVYGGFKLTEPSYALRMDVNPSIEIVSNRLDRVVEVNPLNDDAREMLKEYKLGRKDLKTTVEDLADLMVLTGYISGGKDNLVMITVEDDSVDSETVNNLNEAIVAYLENKQIEATIVNQSISKEDVENQSSNEIVAKRISELDKELEYDQFVDMSLRELVAYAELNGISAQSLFNRVIKTVSSNPKYNADKSNEDNMLDKYIGEARAKEIALELANGEIIEFKLDDYDDDGDDNPEYEIKIIGDGYKYEIEIDAYTGRVLEFEKEASHKDAPSKSAKQLIGNERAKGIALGLVNGKIVKFELDDYDDDDDDPKYEIEIIANGSEYEIEIDAYTGRVLEFEKDD